MSGARQFFMLGLALLCAALLLLRNHDALHLRDASSELRAPVWKNGLLQRSGLDSLSAAEFLCRRDSCSDLEPWPAGDEPQNWLLSMAQLDVKKGLGERPDAPALIHTAEGWMVLWAERGDRLEVLLQGRGAGVLPRSAFKGLYGLPWWGPLR
jgi:hypothetical protein